MRLWYVFDPRRREGIVIVLPARFLARLFCALPWCRHLDYWHTPAGMGPGD